MRQIGLGLKQQGHSVFGMPLVICASASVWRRGKNYRYHNIRHLSFSFGVRHEWIEGCRMVTTLNLVVKVYYMYVNRFNVII